jgi:glycerate-2-kinase
VIIKNFNSLATTKTRKDALEIINSGLESVLTKPSIRKQVKISKDILHIQKHKWNLSKYKRIFVLGFGKASADMAEEIEKIFGKKITRGIVIDTKKKQLSRIKVIKGTHPLPSEINVKATNEIIKILEEADESDLIITLISGGGSALLSSPRINLKEYIEVNKMLLKRGATIQEINTVRKHISKIKGGQLSKIAEKATIISLIVSDVITNDLNIIASGPTVKDPTTIKDAERIRKKYSLPVLAFVETPKNNLKNTTNILLITNIPATEAMKTKAKKLGYKTKILTTQLKGEAKDVGKRLALMSKPKVALIAAGETTVTVKGNGKGGRNQELVLSASRFLKKGVLVSCSTDGVDFITESAGGIADEFTKEKNLNTEKFLENNDSYNFLKKVNGTIITGKTGTNVGDLILVLGNSGDKRI